MIYSRDSGLANVLYLCSRFFKDDMRRISVQLVIGPGYWVVVVAVVVVVVVAVVVSSVGYITPPVE